MKRKDFLDRDDLPGEQFIAELGVGDELGPYCRWLREQVAAYAKIPAGKIYPADDTRELSAIVGGYDALEFHMKAEERFQTQIDDVAAPDLFPVWSVFGIRISGEPITFGEWCVGFATCIREGRKK
ncbi:MAG: hypothetical protein ABFD69_09375 [Candidatus Sumerlaeia bacterium]